MRDGRTQVPTRLWIQLTGLEGFAKIIRHQIIQGTKSRFSANGTPQPRYYANRILIESRLTHSDVDERHMIRYTNDMKLHSGLRW